MELKLGFSWAVVCYHFVLIVLYGIETNNIDIHLYLCLNVLIVLYGIETWAAHIYRIGTAVLIVLYGIETIQAVVLPRGARVLIVLYGIET